MKSSYLIVGLGNPGYRYKNTRHNLGFLVIDKIIERFEIKRQKFSNFFLCEHTFINNKKKVKAFLMQPLTYMNNSGLAVKSFIDKYKTNIDIIVIHDDIDLPLGKIRIKKKSGHGGHNGIKSIIKEINSNDFFRIKIGIGRPEKKEDIPQFVLSNFSENEIPVINKSIKQSINMIIDLMFNQ